MSSLAKYTSVDLGSAYLVLLVPAQFFHLTGYFLLGRKVTGNGVAAFFFSIACSLTVPTFAGDYWGFWREPQPRFLYAAALPFLVMMALDSEDRLSKWLLTFLAAGLATYLHPASGPPVSLAIMAGMAMKAWPTISIQRLSVLVLSSGVVYLLCFAPYAILYLGSVLSAGQGIDGAQALHAARIRFDADYVDLEQGIANAIISTWYSLRASLLILAGAGWWIV